MYQSLDRILKHAVSYQEEVGGIDTKKLNPSVRLEVTTQNSTYLMEFVNGQKGQVRVKGGRHLPELTDMVFMGSTWGGSMIRDGWIGHLMRMEFGYPGTPVALTTTEVQTARLIGDGWEYEMEWPNG